MKEIVRVKLENDMDLILAHKRTMKLCELTGFSLIVQTSTATAVSEIARCAIEFGREAQMTLGIEVICIPAKVLIKNRSHHERIMFVYRVILCQLPAGFHPV